jgi:hypothetical protein
MVMAYSDVAAGYTIGFANIRVRPYILVHFAAIPDKLMYFRIPNFSEAVHSALTILYFSRIDDRALLAISY